VGRYNRYLYSVQFDLQDFLGTDGGFVAHTEGIQRYDRQTGEVILHEFGPRFRTDEVIYVPKADGDEGEGWLLSFVYDRARQTSALSILDANDIEGAEAAMVYLPQRVPHGFHGTWVPER
jgi:carotenoid cleavage dioxygenase